MKNYASFWTVIFFMFGLLAKPDESETILWQPVKLGVKEIDQQDTDEILEQTKDQVEKIEQQVQETVRGIKSDALVKTEKIKQSVTEEVEKVHQDAQEEIEEIKTEAEQDIDEIKDVIVDSVVNIEQRATGQIMDLIREAEEIAFKISRKKREAVVLKKLQQSFDKTQKKLCGFQGLNGALLKIPVPSYWKQRMADNFYKNSNVLEQIVFDAESFEETKDFANCFKAQKVWFDKTLSSTAYTSDPGYSQIIAKKTSIENIVSAIKKSDQKLDLIKSKLDLSDEEKRRIRLIILYEINAALQRLKYLPYKDQLLSDYEVENLTIKVVHDITGCAGSVFPDVNFESIVLPDISREAAVWVQIREDLDDVKSTLNVELLEKNKLADSLKKLNIDLYDLNTKLNKERAVKGNLIQKLELSGRDLVDQQLTNREKNYKLLQKDVEMKNLMSEIAQTKQLLNTLRTQNLEVQNKIKMVEEISIQKAKEQSNIFNSERTKIQELSKRKRLEAELVQRNGIK